MIGHTGDALREIARLRFLNRRNQIRAAKQHRRAEMWQTKSRRATAEAKAQRRRAEMWKQRAQAAEWALKQARPNHGQNRATRRGNGAEMRTHKTNDIALADRTVAA